METNDIIDTRTDADSPPSVDKAQEALRASAQDIIEHATIRTATHGQLVPSTANVRVKPSDLSQLHASIRAHGLLQNLVCFPQEQDGVPTGLWEVAAGKNRWTVIGMLIAEGSLPYDFRIPFLLVTKAEAVLVSLAENLHAPMHPADLFDGMLTLSKQGRSADEIGWMFGLSAKTVRQRLKLANVAPRLFALYREDKASYEQMAALAISDDHQAQQAAWDGLDQWSRQPQRLRKLLTAHCIPVQTDPVVCYVGVKAYEAAGASCCATCSAPGTKVLSKTVSCWNRWPMPSSTRSRRSCASSAGRGLRLSCATMPNGWPITAGCRWWTWSRRHSRRPIWPGATSAQRQRKRNLMPCRWARQTRPGR